MELTHTGQEADDRGPQDPYAKKILQQIGVTRIDEGLIDGSGPVRVDRDKVRAYVLKQLSGEERKNIQALTLEFRDWYEEYRSVLIEIARDSDEWNKDDEPVE